MLEAISSFYLLSLLNLQTYAQTNNLLGYALYRLLASLNMHTSISTPNTVPDILSNRQAAVKKLCQIHKFKKDVKESCVIEERAKGGMYSERTFKGKRTIYLHIYDVNELGEFHKSSEFKISSWYGKATIKYIDLLGDGREFILVDELEGATGSGISQKMTSIVGWNGQEFLPVLLETTNYTEAFSSGNRIQDLLVTYSLINQGTRKVSIALNYKFLAQFPRHGKSKKLNWENILTWDEKNFSFYNENEENKTKQNSSNPIETSIADVRLQIIKLKPRELDLDSVSQTGIRALYAKWH